MRRPVRLSLIGAIWVLAIGFGVVPAAGQQGFVISIDDLVGFPGSVVTARVRISDAAGLFAYDLDVSYGRTTGGLLTLEGANDAVGFQGTLAEAFRLPGTDVIIAGADGLEGDGIVQIAVFGAETLSAGISGTQVLATIQFRVSSAAQPGQTQALGVSVRTDEAGTPLISRVSGVTTREGTFTVLAPPSDIRCTALPLILDLVEGGSGSLTLGASSPDPAPVPGVTVALSVADLTVGSVTPASVTTDEQGAGAATVTAGLRGVTTVTVTCTVGTVVRSTDVVLRVVGTGEAPTRAVIPLISRAGSFVTFVSLQNPNSQGLTVALTLWDFAGNQVPLAQGQETVLLPPGGNQLTSITSLLPVGSTFQTGWLTADFGSQQGNGLALLLQTETFSMTAVPATDAPEADTSLAVTEFRARSNFTGQLVVTNPFDQTATLTITLRGRDGTPVNAAQPIFRLGGVQRQTGSLAGIQLPARQQLEALTNEIAAGDAGSITIISDSPVLAGELFFIPQSGTGNPLAMVFLPAQTVTAQGALDRSAVIPLVSREGAFTTFLSLQNPNPTPVTVSLELFHSSGLPASLEAGQELQTLAGSGNLLIPVDSLLPQGTEFRAGWLRVMGELPTNSLALVLQTATFSMTAVPALRDRDAGAVQHITEFRARSNFTGQIIVTNPSGVEARLDIQLSGRDGSRGTRASAVYTLGGVSTTGPLRDIRLPPRQQLVALTDSVAAAGVNSGSIAITSSVPLMAGELFFIPEANTGNPLAMVFFPAQ